MAESPFELVNYGGNAAPEIVGREGFQAFYMREHREAAEVISPAGKLLGSHMDGCNAPIMDLIGEDTLDYIEAYDPVMSPGVGEAQRALGDRVLSLHFPSAWQTHSEEQVVRDTIGLIEDAADPQRLIIGITEDMDMDRYVPVIRGIMRGIRAYGRIG